MQKLVTKVFGISSIIFGILGILMVLTGTDPDSSSTGLELVISRLFFASIFVILPTFALSIAFKYLDLKK